MADRKAADKNMRNIQRGMTPKQVIRVAGMPDKRIESEGELRLNYGIVWVIFEKGKVACAVKEPHFRSQLHCRDYSPRQKLTR